MCTPLCPICRRPECAHYIGTTTNGRTIRLLGAALAAAGESRRVGRGDHVILTADIARVYRPLSMKKRLRKTADESL